MERRTFNIEGLSGLLDDLSGCASAPDLEFFSELVREWRNGGFTMGPDPLCYLFDAVGPGARILECGSGLSTLVLGLRAKQQSARVISLEHQTEWIKILTPLLQRYGLLEHVSLFLRPLVRLRSGWWYDISDDEIFPATFDFIVCDGPPGSYPGYRGGLMDRFHSRIGDRTTIILDDCHREGEAMILSEWAGLLERPCSISAPDSLGRCWGLIAPKP